ncbi:MAG: 50S ribosomal protein L11 methyltransferase [Nitrospirota bacterium]
MQWYEIEVVLPTPLLESTYNFLWSYVNGLKVKKTNNNFMVNAYLFSPSPHDLLRRLNNFLRIMEKSFQAEYSPPAANLASLSSNSEFLIVPSPAPYTPPFDVPIFLQRGKSFGIGNHPCTIYCLQALKDIFRREPAGKIKKILDAGTGTGILAIASAKLGAKDVTGVEINYESIKEAQENVKLNMVTKEIKIMHCSVTEIKGKFDLILANLHGALLIELATSLARQLSPKGRLILGGINALHEEAVISAFTQHGLKTLSFYRDEEWSVAVLQGI